MHACMHVCTCMCMCMCTREMTLQRCVVVALSPMYVSRGKLHGQRIDPNTKEDVLRRSRVNQMRVVVVVWWEML
jgi:hypothetical protein